MGGEVGGPDSRGGGVVGGWQGARWGRGSGARRARWPTREEMARYRSARWQFLWVVGQEGRWQGARWGMGSGDEEDQVAREGGDGKVQEGQMAVSLGGGAGGGMARSQMGQGQWGKGGLDDWRGDGRVQEGQMAVAGAVGW